jgi:methylmalonyl-CoA mutase
MYEAWLKAVRNLLKNESLERFGKEIEPGVWLNALSPPAENAKPLFPARKWKIVAPASSTDHAIANTHALEDLRNGANALSLGPATAGNLPQVLKNIDLDLIAIRSSGSNIALQLSHLILEKGFDPAALDVDFGLNVNDAGLRNTVTHLQETGYKGAYISARVGQNETQNPAKISEQLSLGLSELVESLRLFSSLGMSQRESFRKISFTVACDHNFLVSVAKLRAFHKLWYKVMTCCGLSPEWPVLHAETSQRISDAVNSDNNILRNTFAAMSAAHSGTSSLLIHPHLGAGSSSHADSRRIAINTQLILLEEANIWRVGDSLCGSGAVEELTNSFARDAWHAFRASWNADSSLAYDTVQGTTAMSTLPDFSKIEWSEPDYPSNANSDEHWVTGEQVAFHRSYGARTADTQSWVNTAAGSEPFVRGPYPTMYATQPWTIRQYAGFSTADESNTFYRRNLAAGQKGLSIAFDLPTHRGYDSDDPLIAGDVGMAGVAIDSILDMRTLFSGIPLGDISVSMTMNGAVLPIMALYILAAEEQGVTPAQLQGTIQNDILKEFMVRNTFIYPPEQSMRIVKDVFAFTSQHMPKFNSISVSGYHMQEAGATADLELAYTLADGVEYIRAGLAEGLLVDNFAPRVSFFFGIGMNYWMEIAKLRAARLLWSELMKQFNPKSKKSLILRTHCQTSGWSLTAQDPKNNLVRTCIEAMASVHGGTQSLHTNSFDEAIALPTEQSAELARNTQLILQQECGTCDTIDPWGGSHFMESLTAQLADRARTHLREIESQGGMIAAIGKGFPKRRITESAIARQAAIDTGVQPIIGVNSYIRAEEPSIKVLKIDNGAVLANQIAKLKALKFDRNGDAVAKCLNAITRCAHTGQGNLLALSLEAARAHATVGEISGALERAWGRHKPASQVLPGVYGNALGVERLLEIRASAMARAFSEDDGRKPKILIAKIGLDGHDRGQATVASAFHDLGFEVEVGNLFATASDVVAQAVESKAHIIGISSLAAAHMTILDELKKAVASFGKEDLLIVIGGVIPPDDVKKLHALGADLVFTPGTNLMTAAAQVLEELNRKRGYAQPETLGPLRS